MLPPNWNSMTPDEKFEARLATWASIENKTFASPEVADRYKRRAQWLIDAIRLKKPERVPCFPLAGGFVADYAGVTHGEMFYDYEKAVQALAKFHRDFDVDYVAAGNFMPGKVFDILGYKLYRYPGGTLPDNLPFQYVESEYMGADEYDALIADPTGFVMKRYIPRVMSNLAGWQMMPTLYGVTELPFVTFMMAPIGAAPPLQQAFQSFLDAAKANLEFLGAMGQIGAIETGELGLPGTAGGFTKLPFDFIGDTLRGTRGVMLDMYRQPDKLLKALDVFTPVAIDMAVSSANANQNPMILVVLHKGADGFMSDKDFAKFYWPTFKAVLMGMINEGLVPFMFVEGSYNHRLDIIAASGLPAGKTMWMFDKTDMAAAKEKFGSWACIGGNVPASLFKTGTPQQMEDCVKHLIDTAGRDGGYFLAPGAVIDNAEPANMHAYFKAARDYGKY